MTFKECKEKYTGMCRSILGKTYTTGYHHDQAEAYVEYMLKEREALSAIAETCSISERCEILRTLSSIADIPERKAIFDPWDFSTKLRERAYPRKQVIRAITKPMTIGKITVVTTTAITFLLRRSKYP